MKKSFLFYLFAVSFAISACSSSEKKEAEEKAKADVAAPTPPVEMLDTIRDSKKSLPLEAPKAPEAVAPTPKLPDPLQMELKPAKPEPVALKPEGQLTSADQALQWLKNGNTRFVKNRLRNDGVSAKDRMRLIEGQKAHSVILACSDSRVPPEVIFDQKLGEVFVVRTLGHALDQTSIASIDYAVEALGAQNVVVLGHESCGATLTANQNAKAVSMELVKRSKAVKNGVESGNVKVHSAMYKLKSGQVTFDE